jgi:NADH-quinone oxidoreductase subunit C
MSSVTDLSAILGSLPQVTETAQTVKAEKGYDIRLNLNSKGLPELAVLLKERGFFLEYITAVDHGENIELVYCFSQWIEPIRVLALCPAWPLEAAPSITKVFPSADWQEREVFDMFGLEVKGHPDLKRILLVDEAGLHPLRKDFKAGPQHSGDVVVTENV